MSLRSTGAAAALLASLLLSGCDPFQPAPGVRDTAAMQAWKARQAQLRNLDQWALSGRAAASGNFGLKGSLRWVQRGDRFTLDVRGPFGIGAARLDGTPQRVVVRSGKQEWITQEPEELLLQEFGWTLPVRALRYWVVGLPAPGPVADFQVDARGRITQLAQADWIVAYADYTAQPLIELPGQLRAEQGSTTLKLSIDRWDLPQ